MWEAGFIHESQIRELWKFSEDYWREWLRKNHVPYRVIARERWFHRDALVQWFLMRPPENESEDEENQRTDSSE